MVLAVQSDDVSVIVEGTQMVVSGALREIEFVRKFGHPSPSGSFSLSSTAKDRLIPCSVPPPCFDMARHCPIIINKFLLERESFEICSTVCNVHRTRLPVLTRIVGVASMVTNFHCPGDRGPAGRLHPAIR